MTFLPAAPIFGLSPFAILTNIAISSSVSVPNGFSRSALTILASASNSSQIKRFVQFLQAALDLAYEIRVGFCSASFAVVRTNGGSGSQELLTQNLCFCRLRQSRVKLNDSKREFSRTLSKILSLIRLHPSSLRPHPFVRPTPARPSARRSSNRQRE